jgi:ComF family protein
LHECKYAGNKELLFQLGKMMGEHLKNQDRFDIDALVPLPLHRHKEKKRGYNQALILCEGMAEVLNLPIKNDLVIRNNSTDTQTKKDRINRWSNMEGKFSLKEKSSIGSHLLLVDDVITTGATLEACGQSLLQLDGVQLSIFALCYSSN